MVLLFELVNVPLLGLMCVRPVMLGGGKAWVGAIGLMAGYGVTAGIALVIGLLMVSGNEGHVIWSAALGSSSGPAWVSQAVLPELGPELGLGTVAVLPGSGPLPGTVAVWLGGGAWSGWCPWAGWSACDA